MTEPFKDHDKPIAGVKYKPGHVLVRSITKEDGTFEDLPGLYIRSFRVGLLSQLSKRVDEVGGVSASGRYNSLPTVNETAPLGQSVTFLGDTKVAIRVIGDGTAGVDATIPSAGMYGTDTIIPGTEASTADIEFPLLYGFTKIPYTFTDVDPESSPLADDIVTTGPEYTTDVVGEDAGIVRYHGNTKYVCVKLHGYYLTTENSRDNSSDTDPNNAINQMHALKYPTMADIVIVDFKALYGDEGASSPSKYLVKPTYELIPIAAFREYADKVAVDFDPETYEIIYDTVGQGISVVAQLKTGDIHLEPRDDGVHEVRRFNLIGRQEPDPETGEPPVASWVWLTRLPVIDKNGARLAPSTNMQPYVEKDIDSAQTPYYTPWYYVNKDPADDVEGTLPEIKIYASGKYDAPESFGPVAGSPSGVRYFSTATIDSTGATYWIPSLGSTISLDAPTTYSSAVATSPVAMDTPYWFDKAYRLLRFDLLNVDKVLRPRELVPVDALGSTTFITLEERPCLA